MVPHRWALMKAHTGNMCRMLCGCCLETKHIVGGGAQAPRAASGQAMAVEPPQPGFEDTQVEEDRYAAIAQSLVS